MRWRIVGAAAALAVLAATQVARAESNSTRAVDQGPIITLGLGWLSAGSPAAEAKTGAVVRGELRTGSADARLYLGTELGYEFALGFAATPTEAETIRDGIPLAVSAALAFSLRAYTFDLPCDGMIVVHAGGEGGLGGAMWWSDGPRFAFAAGTRLALRPAKKLHLELDYTIVPHVFTAAPLEWTLRRTEHRGTLDVGVGKVDVALWATYAETRRHTAAAPGYDRFDALELGAGLGWRW